MRGGMTIRDQEIQQLEEAIEVICQRAKEFNLDFYDMRFEICPADIIYTFGAYGMPTRFSHWSFGKAFHRMKTQYDYNLSKIYELVINSDPCYAFLLEGNSLIQNKLVIAHVFAHCDFFKNNAYYQQTSRYMVDSMAVSAERIRQYEYNYGHKQVELIIDAVLAIHEHIDPYFHLRKQDTAAKKTPKNSVNKPTSSYEDLWGIDEKLEHNSFDVDDHDEDHISDQDNLPEKDLLYFILTHAKGLKNWQRDIISTMREEMFYFWPQIETKIMNEGWASLWHARIMRSLDLDEGESIDFAKMHSSVLQPSKYSINPYYLGYKIWEDIEKRWDHPSQAEREKYGRPGGQGLAKIFEVRSTENDVSFIRNYLTKELVEELDLYLFKKVGYQWQITDKEWEQVRNGIVSSMTNGGFPYILVMDGDYNLNGELYLRHEFEGIELDLRYVEKTLPLVYRLWGRNVHLETMVENKRVLFTYNGIKSIKRLL